MTRAFQNDSHVLSSTYNNNQQQEVSQMTVTQTAVTLLSSLTLNPIVKLFNDAGITN